MRLLRTALGFLLLSLLACAPGGGSGGNGSAISVAVTPAAVSLQAGQPQLFLATVAGSANTGVSWSVEEAGGGQISAAGQYTAPQAAGVFHVRATSVADSSKSGQATVTVTAPVVVSVSPLTAALQTGQTQQFTATVTGTANPAVTWSVLEAGGGSVSAAGLYTAPATAGSFQVRATSVADSSKSAQATVTVTGAVAVSVSPLTAALQTGQTQPFTATVTGSANPAVTWSVLEAGGGSVSAAGLYTAPGSPGSFHVRATSQADPGARGEAVVTVTAAQPPSGYLLLTSARLAQIKSEAGSGGTAWANLKANVDAHLASTDPYDTGPENMALAYLVSGDARYAARAYWWAEQRMAQNLRRDSYYDFGELLEGVALVLNYCAPALSGAQLTTLANYLEASADELWYHNAGSGWGLDNPRNNYHHNFLMGTAYAGYALKAKGDARGDRWIALVKDLLEKPGGVMAYLDGGVPGGDWDEGVNYAEGSKMHLARALAIIAAAGGGNYFAATPFFQNLPRFSLYSLQPGGRFIYPGGDLARDSSMPLSPYDRALLQPVMAWLADSDGRRLGQWLLNHAMPTYLDGDRTFSFRTGLYLDVLFKLNLVETEPGTQPLSYRTATTNWVNLRSGWDEQATSLSISGSPRIFESHQHMDSGSFTLWKGGWQAVDASTFSHSGEIQTPEAHNLLRVPHAQWLTDEAVQVPGLTRFADYGSLGYAQVDATRLYRWALSSSDIRDLLNEHTRELVYLRPNTLVVFDRVDARSDGQGFAWCLHFPTAPGFASGRYSAAFQGGGMSLVKLLGGASSLVSDADLEPGTSSVRVEEAATGATSRFLNVVEVASGAAPTTTAQLVSTPGSVSGAQVGTTVVLFSDRPKGAPAALPFSYTVAGTGTLTHLLCNLAAPVSVTAVASGASTVVTVAAGGTYSPDAQGTVQFTIAPGAAISVAVSPATAGVSTGGTQAFTATVTGTANTAVTWGVVEPAGGSVSAAGLYTAPGSAGTYHVRATSSADPSRYGEATITVTAPPVITVTVSPAAANLFTGGTQAFTATVTGTANTAVTWSVVEPAGGSVSAAGLYTAPGSAGVFHVRATSQASPAAYAEATVTVAAVPPAGPCNAADLGAGASLHGYRPFPADNPWNQDISGSAVDPNSAAIIAFIGATRGLKADFGSGLWEGAPIGIPFHVVGAAQAKVRINFTAYGDESDPGPMPIPAGVQIEGGPASTGDRHVLVMDRDACLLYELYRAFPQADGSWNADSAALWDLKSNNLRPFGWTSADAAGLPLFPGLARYDEVAAGEITHALRFTVPTSRRAYVLPATHWASSNTSSSAPPMGMRMRLKAAVDISGYPAQAQVLLRALKKYGMILADNGSAFFISGAPDEGWVNEQLATLANIKGSDLEVVQMGTIYTADPTGPAPVIASFTATPAGVPAGGAATLNWSMSNATRAFVTPEVGVATGTSAVVHPAVTTAYTLTAEGPYGSATRTVTVNVLAAPVIASFTATPAAITAGQSCTLAWSVSGATGLSIDHGIGTVTGTSVSVAPATTTTYLLTATGPGGTMTAAATVTVSSGLHYLLAYNSGPAAPLGLQPPWIREAWEGTPPVATNLASAAPGRAGTQALEVAFAAGNSWNALGLAHRQDWSNIFWLFFNQFRTLEFDLLFAADSVGEDNLVFILEDGGHADEPRLTSLIPGWAGLTAAQKHGTWFHVTVNLAALHPSAQYLNFERWLLFNNADAAVSRPHFFLYDVKLGWADDAAAPVITFGSAVPDAVSSQLTLTWSTDEPTIQSVEWGPTASYGHTLAGGTAAADYALDHAATLTGLTPGSTCFYRITARDHQFQAGTAPNQSVLAGSFTLPAAPTTPPVISGLAAGPVGAVTATLTWNTDRPCSAAVSYHKSGGPTLTRAFADLASSRTVLLDLLEPATAYAVSVVATDAFGNVSAAATLSLTTLASGPADVTVAIDPASTQPISPWIYGINFFASVAGAPPGITLNRMGGNRWTAYNWENNASNSGSDWGPYSNDAYLGGGSTPAEAVRGGIAADQGRGMASLMTLQLQGYVSADKTGLVNISDPNHLVNRFKQVVFKKGAAFTAAPATTDASVFMDEFLWALRGKFPGDIFAAAAALPTFVSLDNEPELWGDTHAEIQTGLITPAAYIQKTIDLAKALKEVAPEVQLFGPVHYGFNGIVNWQNSGGFTGSYWFTDKYLQELKSASDGYGKRLLDAYDLHWYSEATGDGTRITNLSGATLTANQVQAIVQSPRSLWDPSYTENSWIAQYLGQPVNLLGRLKSKIAASWPGTKIALTEYGNGGDNHIAGALAQADNLGIFGAQGVFAANLWPLNDCPYILAGFRAFRGYDGGTANFGDVSLKATSSNNQNVAAYVSLDSQVPGRVVIVAINRSTVAQTVAFQGQPLAGTARIYRITAESAQAQRAAAQPVAPVAVGQVGVSGSNWTVALPPLSLSTVEIR